MSKELCAICHQHELSDWYKLATCGHEYHAVCLMQWAEKHSTCPTCRAQFARAEIGPVDDPRGIPLADSLFLGPQITADVYMTGLMPSVFLLGMLEFFAVIMCFLWGLTAITQTVNNPNPMLRMYPSMMAILQLILIALHFQMLLHVAVIAVGRNIILARRTCIIEQMMIATIPSVSGLIMIYGNDSLPLLTTIGMMTLCLPGHMRALDLVAHCFRGETIFPFIHTKPVWVRSWGMRDTERWEWRYSDAIRFGE